VLDTLKIVILEFVGLMAEQRLSELFEHAHRDEQHMPGRQI
jgi:hypothetical protein